MEGKEIQGMVEIWKEFVVYVLKGKENILKEVLGELVAIEAIERMVTNRKETPKKRVDHEKDLRNLWRGI